MFNIVKMLATNMLVTCVMMLATYNYTILIINKLNKFHLFSSIIFICSA